MPMPLSSDKLHLTMTKSSTFSGLRDALLAVTTFPAAENTLSDFELAAGTGKTILTRCERSVKYTLQLSWFTLPKTRPEPDPEPGLLTITRPEPDPKSKSATRQALVIHCIASQNMVIYRLTWRFLHPCSAFSSQSALSLVNSLIARGHLGQGTMIQRRGGELQQGFRRDNKDLSTMIVRKAIHLVPAI